MCYNGCLQHKVATASRFIRCQGDLEKNQQRLILQVQKQFDNSRLNYVQLQIGLPDFQSRNTGDFWTRKRVPMATNVVLVVVLVLLLGVLIVIRFSCP